MNESNASALMAAYKKTYRRLFTLAYALTGSEEEALNEALEAMVSTGVSGARGGAFRRILADTRELPLRRLPEDLLSCASDAPDAARVCAFLRYGCGCRPREIARRTGQTVSGVKRLLIRAGDENALRAQCKMDFAEGRFAPDALTFERAMKSRVRAFKKQRGKRTVTGDILHGIAAAALLALLGGLIWLCAILIDYYLNLI